MGIKNRIKSKLINKLIKSGRYQALTDGLYDEIFCKSYCNIEVPSAVIEKTQQGMKMSAAVRQTVLDRVKDLMGRGVVKISNDQFEVFKNELYQSVKDHQFASSIYKRVGRDAGIFLVQPLPAIRVRRHIVNIVGGISDNPHEYINNVLENHLRGLGYEL